MDQGLLGMIVLAMSTYIMYLHRQHEVGRKEWQEIAKEGQEIGRENASIMSALKTLLETTREKR